MDRGADVNSKNHTGRTPLMLAATNQWDEIASILLGHDGVVPDLTDSTGRSALSWATEDSQEVVVLLLETGRADANSKDDHGRTPLSHAAVYGDQRILKRLSETPELDISAADINGRTPLFWACGSEAVVALFLNTGRFDLDSKDGRDRTLLSLAAEEGAMRVTRLLLTRGVCVDSRDDHDRTPLSWASAGSHIEVVKMLLATGEADVNSMDKDGRVPLWWAVRDRWILLGNWIVRQLLTTEGIDPDKADTGGRTVLSWAVGGIKGATTDDRPPLSTAGHRFPSILKGPSRRKNSNAARSYVRQTTLQDEQLLKRLRMARVDLSRTYVQLLLADSRVDPDSKDQHGRSPLSYAAEHGQLDDVKLLLATEKVDLKSEDKGGRTPLWYASRAGRQEMVEFLSARE